MWVNFVHVINTAKHYAMPATPPTPDLVETICRSSQLIVCLSAELGIIDVLPNMGRYCWARWQQQKL